MTSKITRERLSDILEFGSGRLIKPISDEEIELMARMALAAMDSEPVAWMHNNNDLGVPAITTNPKIGHYWAAEFKGVEPLYRHALPMPVMPKEITKETATIIAYGLPTTNIGEIFKAGYDACRAAMLRAVNHTEQHLEMVDHSGDINEMAHVVTLTSEGDIQAEPQSAQQNIPEIIPGWIPVSERMPDCWCRTCRPVVLNDMRFVVCPDCGNKRCPRANDHRNACTGSNEPDQEGSAYPADPQEVPDGK